MVFTAEVIRTQIMLLEVSACQQRWQYSGFTFSGLCVSITWATSIEMNWNLILTVFFSGIVDLAADQSETSEESSEDVI